MSEQEGPLDEAPRCGAIRAAHGWELASHSQWVLRVAWAWISPAEAGSVPSIGQLRADSSVV